MRDAPWIIYGANGVSGRLVLAEALRRGHRPILGGRDPSIHALGEAHKLEAVCVGLEDAAGLAALLKRGSRVLHIAGPYAVTAAPMLDACIATRTPYLDLCGEIGTIGETFARDAEAKAGKIALVAGAGFGVSAAESVAIHVARQARGARRLLLGVKLDNAYKSVAAAMSTLHVLGRGGAWVTDGRLRSGGIAHTRFHATVDGGRHTFIAAPLADVLAAHRSTGIREVIAGIPVPSVMAPILRYAAPLIQRLLGWPGLRRFLERRMRKQAPPAVAPTTAGHRSFVWAQATGERGTSTAVLSIGEGYAFATAAIVRSAELLSSFDGAGAWTPASAFGPDFVLGLAGVQRRDLAA
jgi:saccharopine dehydrogenase (NAD+, L-lysine-forming)